MTDDLYFTDYGATKTDSLASFWEGVKPETDEEIRSKINFVAQPKQRELLRAAGVLDWYDGIGAVKPAIAPIIGYGGSAFGGKTYGVLGLAAVMSMALPGLQTSFFRRTYAEMKGAGTVFEQANEVFDGIAKVRDSGREWNFYNGADFYFRHCENEDDRFQYKGAQIELLLVDEATSFYWSIIDYLLARNRKSGSSRIPKALAVLTSNPGDIGHSWYMQVFSLENIERWRSNEWNEPRTVINPNNKPSVVYFIPAKIDDNPKGNEIDPEYREKLAEREPGTANALLHGDWKSFSGQAFKEFEESRHVCDPFEIPWRWPRWRAVDWGYDKPFCCLWLTKDIEIGRIYVYRELYQAGLTDKQQAEMIALYSPADEGVVMTFGDPSMWVSKSKMGEIFSTASEYAKYGVPLLQADNDRISGKRKVHGFLANLPDGKPGLMIFRNCPHLIRTLPKLARSEANVDDVDPNGQEDHGYDSLRYALTNVEYMSARKRKTEKPQDPWRKLQSVL